jgi:1-aminocyclopropane-1-carboxylate deaminase
MLTAKTNIPIQKINAEVLSKNGVELFIKREDLIHPEISGNKWRKLKYNIEEAKNGNYKTLVTFGGAYSNHIAATAAVGRLSGLCTHGIIRGEQTYPLNSTLQLAKDNGMKFTFVARSAYKLKTEAAFVNDLISSVSKPFLIPEGGSNDLGVLGCEEITDCEHDYDIFVTACGTGSTLAGMVNGMANAQYAIGFPVLKNGGFLNKDVKCFLKNNASRWHLELNYHFGGYAKQRPELILFIREFWKQFGIKLDPVYTSKAMFGLFDLIEKGAIKNKKILFIHTGGLQGVGGFEKRYKVDLFNE